METPKKSLGQHWLHDEATLNYICDRSNLSQGETVLEIGPGTGTLTKKLMPRAPHVVGLRKHQNLDTTP